MVCIRKPDKEGRAKAASCAIPNCACSGAGLIRRPDPADIRRAEHHPLLGQRPDEVAGMARDELVDFDFARRGALDYPRQPHESAPPARRAVAPLARSIVQDNWSANARRPMVSRIACLRLDLPIASEWRDTPYPRRSAG